MERLNPIEELRSKIKASEEDGQLILIDLPVANAIDNTVRYLEQQIDALRAIAPKATATAPAAEESICAEADRIVSLDRQADYGHPADNFMRIGAMWEAVLDLPPGAIGPEKVALCMITLKVARLCHAIKRDSIVDIAGFAKTLDMVRTRNG